MTFGRLSRVAVGEGCFVLENAVARKCGRIKRVAVSKGGHIKICMLLQMCVQKRDLRM